jgi:hypothetical protein
MRFPAAVRRQYVDLRPYLNPCPFTIHAHAPAERALELLWVIKLAVKAMVPSLEQDSVRSKEQQQVSDSTTLRQSF